MLRDVNDMLHNIVFHVPELSRETYEQVEEILAALSGVQTPGINYFIQELKVSFYPKYISQEQITAALEAGGFHPRFVADETKF